MKYKIGQLVREGGPLGPISKIVNYKNGYYEVHHLEGNAIGYLEEEYLKPYKERHYEQLRLF